MRARRVLVRIGMAVVLGTIIGAAVTSEAAGGGYSNTTGNNNLFWGYRAGFNLLTSAQNAVKILGLARAIK